MTTTINTLAPDYSFIVPHGEPRVFNLVATYLVSGVPTIYPLTGDSITLLVKANRTDADSAALITATVGSGLAITDGPNGKFTWTIDANVTKGPTGFTTFQRYVKYYWAAKVLSGINQSVAFGVIRFTPMAVSIVA